MTKEDCIDALLELFDYAKKGRYIRPGGTGIDTYLEEKADVLLELIHDRFDNFPLMFEELKEGMWVWDDKLKEWCVLGSFWKDALNRYYVGGLSDSPWEQNRFYRKQVKE